jgi:hypothetical protein
MALSQLQSLDTVPLSLCLKIEVDNFFNSYYKIVNECTLCTETQSKLILLICDETTIQIQINMTLLCYVLLKSGVNGVRNVSK